MAAPPSLSVALSPARKKLLDIASRMVPPSGDGGRLETLAEPLDAEALEEARAAYGAGAGAGAGGAEGNDGGAKPGAAPQPVGHVLFEIVAQDPRREALKVGSLQRQARLRKIERLCVLATDFFLFVKEVGGKRKGDAPRLELKQLIWLRDLRVDPGTQGITKAAHAFSLVTPHRTFGLVFKGAADREAWWLAFKDALAAHRERQGKRHDQPKRQRAFTNGVHGAVLGTIHSCAVLGDRAGLQRLVDADKEAYAERLKAYTAACVERVKPLPKRPVRAVNARDDEGYTPLHLAAVCGHADCVALLLANRAQVNDVDAHNHTAMWLACVHGKRQYGECMRVLAKRGGLMHVVADSDLDVDDDDDDDDVEEGDDDGVREETGEDVTAAADDDVEEDMEDVDVEDDDMVRLDGTTLLNAMVARGRAPAVRVLLDRDSSGHLLRMQDERTGRTALHTAAAADNEELIKMLLSFGAPPNCRDYKRNTPLHLTGSLACAKLLCAGGARADIKNCDGTLSGGVKAAGGGERHQAEVLKNHRQAYFSMGTECVEGDGTRPDDVHWVADNDSSACLLCGTEFTLVRRRHHCRRCGMLVCAACSTKKFRPDLQSEKAERCCDSCYLYLKHAQERRLACTLGLTPAEERQRREALRRAERKASFAAQRRRFAAQDKAARTALDEQRREIAANTARTKDGMARNKEMLLERGERLRELEHKAQELDDESATFADLATQLRKKYE